MRYLNNDGPTIEYLQNLDVPDGTAKTIAESLRKLMVQLVRFAMSPKRVWRDFCVQIELGVEIANLGGE